MTHPVIGTNGVFPSGHHLAYRGVDLEHDFVTDSDSFVRVTVPPALATGGDENTQVNNGVKGGRGGIAVRCTRRGVRAIPRWIGGDSKR